jgi:hypothetical protein
MKMTIFQDAFGWLVLDNSQIRKSPLLAQIKCEPIFFPGSLAVFQSEKVASELGGDWTAAIAAHY